MQALRVRYSLLLVSLCNINTGMSRGFRRRAKFFFSSLTFYTSGQRWIWRRYKTRPNSPEMVSESGKAHQVHPSPKRDNSQKMGIRQMISRITEIATLTFAAPIAWKNTGVIRENTAEKKLSPIMRGMSRVDFERI